MDKGHGRLEKRTLRTTPVLQAYLAEWPGIAQVFQLHRVRQSRDKVEEETAYGISSLPVGEANARRLLGLVRGHWGIENRLHGVRDVTLGEDGCRVRSGTAPQVLAATRNAVVHLLEEVEAASKAAALRHFAIFPLEAFALLTSTPQSDN
jgi:predicted transposase YbfD/YdcC